MEGFYDLRPGVEMVKKSAPTSEYISTEQIKKFFKDGAYRQVEDYIFQALFFHHFLTKQNIIRFVNRKLSADNKDGFYENILKQLHIDGCIDIYTYQNVTLYALTEITRTYLGEKYKNSRNRILTPPSTDTASILECASLAQWHISLFCGELIKRSYFYEKSYIGNMQIQFHSYLEFIKSDFVYHVISNVLPKDKKTTDEFFTNIKTISHALRNQVKFGKKHIFLNIIIAPDLESIKKVARFLSGNDSTKDMTFYFMIEEQTISTKGLKLLYTYEDTGKDIILATIKFKE